ncbi:hypothetical protein YC2023_100484 [Brassica napus]
MKVISPFAKDLLCEYNHQSFYIPGGNSEISQIKAPKKDKVPPPSSKPAKSGGGKQKKKMGARNHPLIYRVMHQRLYVIIQIYPTFRLWQAN